MQVLAIETYTHSDGAWCARVMSKRRVKSKKK
jgi:hypothetical protein